MSLDIPVASIKKQLKDGAGDLNVSSDAVEETANTIDHVFETTSKAMAAAIKTIKRKTIQLEYLQYLITFPAMKAKNNYISSAVIIRNFKSRSGLRVSEEAKQDLTDYINDYIFNLGRLAGTYARQDKKKTLLANHIIMADRDVMISSMKDDCAKNCLLKRFR
jgi:histone H3/H4